MSSVVNVASWDNDRKRASSFVVLGLAIVVALGALAMWWFLSTTPAWLYWALLGVLALVLVFMALLVLLQPKSAPAQAEQAPPVAAQAAAASAATPAAPAFEPRVLTLRCGDCGTIFEITDTGERPLYHTCPGCGAEGALRDPVEPPMAAAEPAAPAMASEAAYAPPPATEEAAPAVAPAAAPPKKLKLRCGGCKEVFSLDDPGTRPLRHACPHCGRMGQIN